jgi:hypothetical protein
VNDLHFGLCIGIDRYPGFPGRDLSSAAQDAVAFREWLIAPDGGALPEGNAKLVTVPATEAFTGVFDARPKMQEVLQALRAINEQIDRRVAARPADWSRTRLYIYAAGHGIAIPNGEGAVLMADAEPEVPGLNLDLSLYADWYMRCGLVHEVIVVVDCCREVAEGMPPGVVFFKHCPFPAAKGTIRFVAYASRWGEDAYEPDQVADADLTRGYFTEALIAGLNGAAEEKGTREVTAASLAEYVAQAVEEKTQPPAAPYPQRAEMPVDLGYRMVLRDAPGGDAPVVAIAASNGEATSHTATIHFPDGFDGAVVIRSSDGVERGRWTASDGDWEITLPDTFYEVVPEPPNPVVFANDGLFKLVGRNRNVDL